MMQPQLASIRHRVLALGINFVLGTLPVSLPNVISIYGATDTGWALSQNGLVTIAITIALAQLIFVHKMQGSPGAVFAGLRIQYLNGSSPTLKTTLLRSLPYLIGLFVNILMKRSGLDLDRIEFLSGVLLVVIGFIIVSGATVLINGKSSLLDRITGTVVIKAHRINVPL